MAYVSDKVFRKKAGANDVGRYKSSFNDLEPGTAYHDPMGWRTGKQFTAKESLYKAEKDNIRMFNELQRKGFSVKDSIHEVRKALDTGDWTLPIWFLPELELVNPYETPLADMLSRQTINQLQVIVQNVAEGDEPAVNTNIESQTADYEHSDIVFSEETFDVGDYSIMAGVTDKMIVAGSPIRNPEQTVEKLMLESIRKWEEEEIIKGTGHTGYGDVFTRGLGDEATAITSTPDEDAVTKTEIRELIRNYRKAGGSVDNMAIVTNFEAYDSLKESLDSLTKYSMLNESELSFGYRTLSFDNIPIMPSHGVFEDVVDGGTNQGEFHTIGFNANRTWLGMLYDSVVRPLGRRGPQEKLAVDTAGALVHEKPDHVFGIVSSTT